MVKSSILLIALAGLCRADLITFGSTPADTVAVLLNGTTLPTVATSPFPTPCCVVTYAGSEWVTALTEQPFAIEEQFFIPLNFQINEAAILFKTNFVQGPGAFINGQPVNKITYSEIRDITALVHPGLNTFLSEVDPGITVDVGFDINGFVPCDPPATTPEPATFALAGVGLLAVGIYKRKRRVSQNTPEASTK